MSARRKDPWRTVGDGLFWPVSMLAAKHTRSKRLSQLRVIVMLFAVRYAQHWPSEWTTPAVAALAVITFALAVDTLFAKVPASEAMTALAAFFGSVVGRAAKSADDGVPRPWKKTQEES